MSDSNKHAILSPSSAERWMACPGSVLLERGLPDIGSSYADEGTKAHKFAAFALETNRDWPLPEDFEPVQEYVNSIREISKSHELLIEQRLPIGHITDEEGAEGTGDTIILYNDGETLGVRDFKYGMGVRVYAKNNKQLMLYALGALHQFGVLGNYKKFILGIHQPRLNHMDEWECTLDELNEFAVQVKDVTQFIWRLLKGEVKLIEYEDLFPSEETCRFCKAKSICPALIKRTFEIVSEDFVDLSAKLPAKIKPSNLDKIDNTKLAYYMQNAGLIEDFISAIRAKVESELIAGREVPGFKLVQGKKGNRKWADDDLVEKELKAMRLKSDEMYKSEIISVAVAENLLKSQPKRWAKLLDHIVQNEGKPSVAASTDPRPALAIGATEDDFEDLTKSTELLRSARPLGAKGVLVSVQNSDHKTDQATPTEAIPNITDDKI